MVTKEINQEADFSLTDQEPTMLTVQAGKQSDVTFHYYKTEDSLKVKRFRNLNLGHLSLSYVILVGHLTAEVSMSSSIKVTQNEKIVSESFCINQLK